MRDPLSWSLPIGRLFGITIRVHLLFPFVAAGLILRVALQTKPPMPEQAWIDAAIVMALLFVSVPEPAKSPKPTSDAMAKTARTMKENIRLASLLGA